MARESRNPVTKRQGRSVNVILTVVLIAVAVAVLGGVLLINRSDRGSVNGRLRPADSHTLSQAKDDKVTVVEFLDFQCPACASYYVNTTKKLEQDYQGRIKFVPRNFPLDVHPLAVPAARVAEAAGKQGKYSEMYHALFDGFTEWARSDDGQSTSDDLTRATASFERFAKRLGLDLERFRADTASPGVQAIIDRDIADGREVGVSGTPTFFVNGEKFKPHGRKPADVDRELRMKIDKELAE